MGTADFNQKSFFQKPGKYRIKVQGSLDGSWSRRLCGMRITGEGADDDRKTILEGDLRDQAQLSGVLNSLYELHMAILSVELLEFGNHGNTISSKR